MEESREEVRGADSTLRKEAYGRNFLQHCNSTTWTLCVEAHSTVYDGEGLEFKGVFISYARTCGSTVWKTVCKMVLSGLAT